VGLRARSGCTIPVMCRTRPWTPFAALFLLVACSRERATTPARPAAAPPATTTTTATGSHPPALVVDSPPRAAMLAAGDPAPVFRAFAHDGRRIAVSPGPRLRVLVVYFYPRDETPGCTREAEAFRDAQRVYDEAGADIVGVSTDTEESHRAFAQNHALPFGLVADPDGRLAAAFGVELASGIARRTTFVIGRDGRIARVFPGVQVAGHADEVIAAVRATQ
jgi:peroxiredoxin Q/BCP